MWLNIKWCFTGYVHTHFVMQNVSLTFSVSGWVKMYLSQRFVWQSSSKWNPISKEKNVTKVKNTRYAHLFSISLRYRIQRFFKFCLLDQTTGKGSHFTLQTSQQKRREKTSTYVYTSSFEINRTGIDDRQYVWYYFCLSVKAGIGNRGTKPGE